MRFNKYLLEKASVIGKIDLQQDDTISWKDLRQLEKILDRLFDSLGIDIEFTKHFMDRVNDPRNKKQITFQELHKLFTKTYSKFGKQLSNMGDRAQGLIDDIQTDINIPFVLQWNNRTKELELVTKTVMRKKNFKTHDRIFKV